MSRKHPDPMELPYRPCVGVLLLNPTGLAFVGRRHGGPEQVAEGYQWQMPQGGIDKGEDPRAAAERELWEETGIRAVRFLAEHPAWVTYDLPPELVGHAWKGRYRGQTQKWFAYRFEGRDDDIDVVNPPDGHTQEFDAWRWEPIDRLPGLVVPFKRQAYEQVIAGLRPLLG